MEKIVITSDIHGNIPVFETVFEGIRERESKIRLDIVLTGGERDGGT